MNQVHRIAVANVSKLDLARAGQDAGLAGTVQDGALGFGAWGIEPTCVVETSEPWDQVRPWLINLLRQHGEDAAYVTHDGANPELIYATGQREAA